MSAENQPTPCPCPILEILQQLPGATVVLDSDRTVVGLDARTLAIDQGRALLGRDYLELLSRQQCVVTQAPQKIAEHLNDLFGGKCADFSADHLCRQAGIERAFRIEGTRTEGPDGPRIVLTYEDTTERARTERDLRILRYSVEHASEAFFWIDPDGLIDDVNQAACSLTGYSREALLSMRVQQLRPDLDWPAHWEKTRRVGLMRQECDLRTRDGRMIPVEVTVNFVVFDGREVHFSIVRDMTEHRHLEEQFRQSQKLEAIGRLAGGVAHDFNNLLTVIGGYSNLLIERLPLEDPNLPLVHEIAEASRRAASLTRQLLAFSRKQLTQPVVLDLNEVLTQMSKMLRRLIGEDVRLQITPSPNPASIRADAGHLEQIIMNMSLNARDAMPDGGALTIEATHVHLDEASARHYVGLLAGRYVMLAIRDTGCGMTPEVRSHLFEPFFTTKEKGKGTGLGLSTVYGIIQQAGGFITCETEVGKGTTFRILFPEAEGSKDASTRIIPLRERSAGRETVLLAEDEASVRGLVRAILSSAGYTILEAADGEQALKVAEGHSGPIDLLLTDMVMPNLTGPDLARRLSVKRPEMGILFMSGYVDREIAGGEALKISRHFIQKPFTPEALALKVRETLDRRRK